MNLGEIFIRRPVMTTLVMLAILLFGVMGYRVLPVSDLPAVDFPTIQVSAGLPGASPETMAATVATPLERQFSTIAGVDSMTSTSTLGSTQITLQFSLDRDIDAAAQDVQAAITAAQRQLPPQMPTPPTYSKVNPAESPVLFLSLNSTTQPLSVVDEYGQTVIGQRISMVNGVAQVMVFGSQKYAVRVQVDPTVLAARGIGIDEVQQAIQRSNVNLPTGTLYGPDRAFLVQAAGQLTSAAAYRPIIVAWRNGSPVRLEELGRVIDGVQNDKTAGWFNDRRAVMLAIQKQPGTNTVAVVDAIRDLLPEIRTQIPASVNLDIVYDRSQPIRESVHDVKFTLFLTVCLVVLVIFLFLRNLSATAIPSLALPMSIVGTFSVMYLLDYSLDNLSLMALTLSAGFVVDDAIVMLENIVRHMEMGEKPFQAALSGSKEISFTILSMTLSLAAVFIPVLFMGGILGRLFHEFAVTIGAAILASGFVSLSLTPMLCSRFLRPPAEQRHSRLYRVSERAFQAMLRGYQATLRPVLRRRLATLLVSLGFLGATAYLFFVVPKGFIPSQDVGQIYGFTEAPQGISFEAMVRNQQAVAAVVRGDPNVQSFMSSVGGGPSSAAGNTGRIFLYLKPRSERRLTPEEVIEELRPKLAAVPGLQTYLQTPPTIRIGGQLTKSSYQVTLQSADLQELYRWAPVMERQMRELPGLTDVTSDLLIRTPQVMVDIDRDRAAALGLSAEQVENALYSAYGSRQVSNIYTPTNQYWVILELEPRYQRNPDALALLYVRSSNGRLTPLSAVTRWKETVGPLTIGHLGQLPAVTVSFNLKPGVPLGEAIAQVEEIGRTTLQATINLSFQGTARAFQSSLRGMGWLLLMAVLVIYMVLGILYESFLHPLTILSGLPSAGLGALATLLVFRQELNIYSFVGIIMLVGIVKKNGIMMIDFALEAQRSQGKPPVEAIYDACVVRFRPIMMTTMAALVGTLPIALGFGAGGEARRPLGLAVEGGLVVSQLLTLYITPVYFVSLESLRTWRARRRERRASRLTAPEPAPAGTRRAA